MVFRQLVPVLETFQDIDTGWFFTQETIWIFGY